MYVCMYVYIYLYIYIYVMCVYVSMHIIILSCINEHLAVNFNWFMPLNIFHAIITPHLNAALRCLMGRS